MRKLLILAILGGAVSAHAVTLISSKSAYVQSGANASTNYGSSADLLVKNYNTNGDWNRKSYVEFDLSSVGAVTSAQFRIRTNGYLGTYANTTHTFNVYGATGLNWNETSVNWNSAPGNAGSGFATLQAPMTLLGTFTINSTQVSNTDITFSSASLLSMVNGAAGSPLTIGISRVTPETSGNTIVHRFFSDDTAFGPQLELNPVPEPASMAILGLGFAGLARRRRK